MSSSDDDKWAADIIQVLSGVSSTASPSSFAFPSMTPLARRQSSSSTGEVESLLAVNATLKKELTLLRIKVEKLTAAEAAASSALAASLALAASSTLAGAPAAVSTIVVDSSKAAVVAPESTPSTLLDAFTSQLDAPPPPPTSLEKDLSGKLNEANEEITSLQSCLQGTRSVCLQLASVVRMLREEAQAHAQQARNIAAPLSSSSATSSSSASPVEGAVLGQLQSTSKNSSVSISDAPDSLKNDSSSSSSSSASSVGGDASSSTLSVSSESMSETRVGSDVISHSSGTGGVSSRVVTGFHGFNPIETESSLARLPLHYPTTSQYGLHGHSYAHRRVLGSTSFGAGGGHAAATAAATAAAAAASASATLSSPSFGTGGYPTALSRMSNNASFYHRGTGALTPSSIAIPTPTNATASSPYAGQSDSSHLYGSFPPALAATTPHAMAAVDRMLTQILPPPSPRAVGPLGGSSGRYFQSPYAFPDGPSALRGTSSSSSPASSSSSSSSSASLDNLGYRSYQAGLWTMLSR